MERAATFGNFISSGSIEHDGANEFCFVSERNRANAGATCVLCITCVQSRGWLEVASVQLVASSHTFHTHSRLEGLTTRQSV